MLHQLVLKCSSFSSATKSYHISYERVPISGTLSYPPLHTIPMLLQLPGTNYPTNNSPCIPPFLPSQGNIVMPVNKPSTLRTPTGNKAYLFYHPNSAIICTSATSIVDHTPKSPQPTSQSAPLPIDPPNHLNEINSELNTRSQTCPTPLLQHPRFH